MAYLYELPNSTAGLDGIVLQMTTGSFYWLVPVLLVFLYLVVFLGGVTRQKVRTGTADYAAWSTLASISVLLLGLLLSVTAGYIRLDWLLIIVSVNILSGAWLFLDKKSTEI